MVEKPSDAIAALGGYRQVASMLALPYTTVQSWGTRESIPAAWWPKLISFAKELKVKGLTYEVLALAHERQASAA